MEDIKIVTTKRGKNRGKTSLKYLPSFRRLSKYVKRKPNQFSHSKRFLSIYDLAEAKRAVTIYNSRVNRGEIERKSHGYHYICGCGVEGCVGYSEYNLDKNN